MNSVKHSVKAWAIFNGGGHLLVWTIRRTRGVAIADHLKSIIGSPNRASPPTWRERRRDLGLACRRVTVTENHE
jgi:hypothetical protein